MRDLEEEIVLDRNRNHSIEVLVDRLAVKPGARSRLAEALELALARSEGLAAVETAGGERFLFSERFACPDCGVSFPEMSPRAFSFNSPHGACPECGGLGTRVVVDPDRVVPDPGKSLAGGAVAPWEGKSGVFFRQMLARSESTSTWISTLLGRTFRKKCAEPSSTEPKRPWTSLLSPRARASASESPSRE